MAPIAVGAITGLLLSATSSYLITARLFHPYQAKTPATWRKESWRQHAFAMIMQMVAGASLGWLFAIAGAPPVGAGLFSLIAAAWIGIAVPMLVQALYVNWHAGFVIGLLLDWAVLVVGVFLACSLVGPSISAG
jgi:hypothetical protein